MIIKRDGIKKIESILPPQYKKYKDLSKKLESMYPEWGADWNVPLPENGLYSEWTDFEADFIPIILLYSSRCPDFTYDFKNKTWAEIKTGIERGKYVEKMGRKISWPMIKSKILDLFRNYLKEISESWEFTEPAEIEIKEYLEKAIKLIQTKL